MTKKTHFYQVIHFVKKTIEKRIYFSTFQKKSKSNKIQKWKSKMKKSKMKKSKMKKSKIKLSTFLFVDKPSPELKWLFKQPLKTRGMLSVLKILGFVKNGQKWQKTHFYQVIHFVKTIEKRIYFTTFQKNQNRKKSKNENPKWKNPKWKNPKWKNPKWKNPK